MRTLLRRYIAGVIVAVLVHTTAGLGAASTVVAAEEGFSRPISGVFQLSGHGFGHGRGMSQYGARGAATLGVAWTTILSTYYPGTVRDTRGGRIRVKVSALDPDHITVSNAVGLIVTLADSGVTVWRGSDVLGYRVTRGASGLRLETFDGARYSVVPGAEAISGAVRFDNAAKQHRLWMTSGASRTYRGVIDVRRGPTRLEPVVDLPLEDYLRSVVPAEMPPSWPAEALKAQSVAARSYAARARAVASAGSTFDLCDTEACQVFAGTTRYSSSGVATSVEDARTDAAVIATSGTVLSYAGAVALTEFSSSNGGWTVASALPYQVAKADPWDAAAPNPSATWSASLPASQIEAKYPAIGTLRRLVIVDRDGNGDWGGRVRTVRFEGSTGNVTVSGDAVRAMRPFGTYADGLRSNWFTISQKTEPFGQLDTVTPTAAGVSFTGWAIDPESTAPIDVHVYVDGSGRAMTANGSRPDVASVYPAYGSNHGFSGTITALPGNHTVCAYGINVLAGAGYNPALGCKNVRVPGSTPYGEFWGLTAFAGAVVVTGWAVDPDTTSSIDVHVYVDSQGHVVPTNMSMPDIATLLPAYGDRHGFNTALGAAPGLRTVCAYAINVGDGAGYNPKLGCRQIWVPGPDPFGQLDSVTVTGSTIAVHGWATDPDTSSPIAVHVYVDKTGYAVTAGLPRADVAALYPLYGASHGYATTVPATSGTHTVCAYAINVLKGAGNNPLLGCRLVTVP